MGIYFVNLAQVSVILSQQDTLMSLVPIKKAGESKFHPCSTEIEWLQMGPRVTCEGKLSPVHQEGQKISISA